MPRVLTDDEIERLLAVFNRKTVVGRRDHAITRCLIDLGIRAEEVVRLRLDDIDWRKGRLRIVGAKSRRDDALPLPAAVAESIAAFLLRGRPETTERQVFVRLRPPAGRGITRPMVRGVIRRAAALLHSSQGAFDMSRTVDHSVSGHAATGSAERRIHQNGGRPYL